MKYSSNNNMSNIDTITIVVRMDTEDKAIALHRAFKRPMEAIHLCEELNLIADKENLHCVWYTYTMIVE